jgi:hypothetical protein
MLLSNGSLIKMQIVLVIARASKQKLAIPFHTRAYRSLWRRLQLQLQLHLQRQHHSFRLTVSHLQVHGLWQTLCRDYHHIIPRPMPMSASESELPPLISLQTNYVPGPMVYRDWLSVTSWTRRNLLWTSSLSNPNILYSMDRIL